MHTHTHTHAPGGSGIVLDIGGNVGAVVVYLDDDADVGDELEMEPAGNPAARFHTGVHRRDIGGGAIARVAVFPEVVTGSYHLLDAGGEPFAAVDAAGGEVRTLDLR